MQSELLRALLLDFLKLPHAQDQLQYTRCIDGVTGMAEQKCPEELMECQPASFALRDEDKTRLKHVIWDLILERVLVPSTKSPGTLNDGWPFLSLTDHGLKVVADTKPVPYDPDGYLGRLDKATGGIHPTIKKYLEESLRTFSTGNRLSSAVMLGAASEMLFLELCSSIALSIANPADRTTFENATGPRKNMLDRISTVTNWINQKKNQLPTDWLRREQVGLIDKISDLIRSRRNDAGHPQDPPAELAHEEMYALLMVFPHYCEKLYELKAWLAARPNTIT